MCKAHEIGFDCKAGRMAAGGAELKLCGVCGDKAFGFNFGALTCESCKAFFRRNAIKDKEFRCLFKDDCEVNVRTRRFCQRCRLHKCFAIGMKKECILSEAEKREKRAKIEENRLKRALPYCAAEEPVAAAKRRAPDSCSSSESSSSTDCSPPAVGCAIRSQFYPPGLPSEALTEAEALRLQELATANQVLKVPLACDPEPSLVDVINMTDHAIRRLIKMSKRIAAFKSLCQEDQLALLKGGSTELMLLRSVMSYDAERDCWKGPDPRLMSIRLDILKEARGNVYEEHKRFINAFRPEWRLDENIMLLLSAITLFTPERPNLVHRDVVTLEQDTYLYLLRRYLDTLYSGCESRSVFLQLIRNLEDMRTLNENQVSILVDLNPHEVEPLLIEIFDLK